MSGYESDLTPEQALARADEIEAEREAARNGVVKDEPKPKKGK
jgi:hypothetical protein